MGVKWNIWIRVTLRGMQNIVTKVRLWIVWSTACHWCKRGWIGHTLAATFPGIDESLWCDPMCPKRIPTNVMASKCQRNRLHWWHPVERSKCAGHIWPRATRSPCSDLRRRPSWPRWMQQIQWHNEFGQFLWKIFNFIIVFNNNYI